MKAITINAREVTDKVIEETALRMVREFYGYPNDEASSGPVYNVWNRDKDRWMKLARAVLTDKTVYYEKDNCEEAEALRKALRRDLKDQRETIATLTSDLHRERASNADAKEKLRRFAEALGVKCENPQAAAAECLVQINFLVEVRNYFKTLMDRLNVRDYGGNYLWAMRSATDVISRLESQPEAADFRIVKIYDELGVNNFNECMAKIKELTTVPLDVPPASGEAPTESYAKPVEPEDADREPAFLLRAGDVFALPTLQGYIQMLKDVGLIHVGKFADMSVGDLSQLFEVERAFMEYRCKNPQKVKVKTVMTHDNEVKVTGKGTDDADVPSQK